MEFEPSQPDNEKAIIDALELEMGDPRWHEIQTTARIFNDISADMHVRIEAFKRVRELYKPYIGQQMTIIQGCHAAYPNGEKKFLVRPLNEVVNVVSNGVHMLKQDNHSGLDTDFKCFVDAVRTDGKNPVQQVFFSLEDCTVDMNYRSQEYYRQTLMYNVPQVYKQLSSVLDDKNTSSQEKILKLGDHSYQLPLHSEYPDFIHDVEQYTLGNLELPQGLQHYVELGKRAMFYTNITEGKGYVDNIDTEFVGDIRSIFLHQMNNADHVWCVEIDAYNPNTQHTSANTHELYYRAPASTVRTITPLVQQFYEKKENRP